AVPGVAIGGIGPGTVGGGGGGGGGGPGTGGEGGGGGGTGEVPNPPPVVAVPEPQTWTLMLLGFGLLGAALRWRAPAKRPTRRPTRGKGRRKVAYAGGGMAFAALEPVSAMSAAAGTGSKMTILAKAAMCVCPPALMVGTVAAVPQARKAVYAATMPKQAVPSFAPQSVTPPCDPNLPSPVIVTS
ncbi:MAG TPA: PEPxxWA-CTERM sorting domain-containing protein, partial [Sphingomonas sp.]|nr:PEPxxWA-CTERM sorting domain-containing protein [Sphingomonas sp.]